MEKNKTALYKALNTMMKPLIRIVLKYGVSHAEFSELAKNVFVEVADAEFTVPGRKQTSSRVSVLTGLNRKEVTRIKKSLSENESQGPTSQNRAFRVVNGWLKDERFHTDQGKPRILPMYGDTGSFTELIKHYSGDLTARAVLDELRRVGAVEKTDDDMIKLSTGAYIPQSSPDEKLKFLGTNTSDLLNTFDHNLEHSLEESRLQLSVTYEDLPSEIIPKFKKLSEKEGYQLLRQLDSFLSENDREHNPAVEGTGRFRAGVGIYYFEEDLSHTLERVAS